MGLRPARDSENQRRRHVGARHGVPLRAHGERIFMRSGGPKAHGNSPENHVIPAEAGIHWNWVPAFAGTTTQVIFIPLDGPQAHGHSE